ncbi:hypothetical protein LBMAG21_00790 [Armatimonadota bacterium]|nr:hypothetical protein [Armatimonadota bacterium]GDX39787.1 hypothetical protein LBMAG21_00790 [Armatimonadota bacterium]
MSKSKPERTTPKIAGSPVYGQGSLAAKPGNFVYIHRQKYHVFVGLQEVLVTDDKEQALTAAASATAL